MAFPCFLGFTELLLLIVALGYFLYKRVTRYRNYWRDQNLVHEPLSLFFGPQLKQLFKPYHIVEQELYKKHGRLYGSFEDGKPMLYVAEPDLVKLVLVKDASKSQRMVCRFDDPILSNLIGSVGPEKWKVIRSATSPAFSTGKLRKMQAIVDSCAAAMSERLKEAASKSRDTDLRGFFGQYTVDVMASCAFGAKLPPDSPEMDFLIKGGKNAFFVEITPLLVLKAFLQQLSQAFHERFFNAKAFEYYKSVTLDIIQQREESNVRNEDFLQMMMNAKEVSKTHSEPAEQSALSPETECPPLKPGYVKNLSEQEALAQCVGFFLAGQDTTSSTISFAAYFLALIPSVQTRLRAEVDECFRKHGNAPSYDEISKLPYLDCVVNETLRMMPTGARIERTLNEDYVLGNTGIKVPRECRIVIPTYAMHHDSELFPEPEVFNPDRFNESNVKSIRPYTYMPFGAGPRNCIAMRFATQILKTSLLHAVHDVQFVRCSKTKDPLEFQVGYGLLQPKELVVSIRERCS